MKYIAHILAFMLGFLPLAIAGWDTTLFDGSSKQFGSGYERTLQTYTAIVERAKVTWGDSWTNNVTTTPRRWGSSWSLKEAKADIVEMIERTNWVNTAEIVGGTFDTYFEGVTHDAAFQDDPHFPLLDATNILANAGAPANWFAENPHWGTVTHSNGWQYLDDVINEMVAVQRTDATPTNQFKYVSGAGTSWAAAKSDAETEYAAASWAYDDYLENRSYQQGRADGSADYLAWINHYREWHIVTNRYPFAADWSGYQFAEKPTGIVPDESLEEWDSYGTALTNTYTEIWTETMPTNTQTETTSINPTMPGTWPQEPDHTVGAYEGQTIRGYDAWNILELWRFDVTNGFDYVEQ